jgi:hypothetical protein
MQEINSSNAWDVISAFIAFPLQVLLYVFVMLLVANNWIQLGIVFGMIAALSALLYYTWYRRIHITPLFQGRPGFWESDPLLINV